MRRVRIFGVVVVSTIKRARGGRRIALWRRRGNPSFRELSYSLLPKHGKSPFLRIVDLISHTHIVKDMHGIGHSHMPIKSQSRSPFRS